MFGPVPGIQAEHYNHSNCTYVGGQPGTWRGSQQSMGIAWTIAAALYGGSRLTDLEPWEFSCGPRAIPKRVLRYQFAHKKITVDGDPSDWEGVQENVVEGPEHLWFGQGMTPDKWHGNQDLSFRWCGAWYGDKLYFLFHVTDDHVIDPPRQPLTWLNDCIEIQLDPLHLGGPRKEQVDGKERLRGYEMHFVPTSTPVIIVQRRAHPWVPDQQATERPFQDSMGGRVCGEKNADRVSGGDCLFRARSAAAWGQDLGPRRSRRRRRRPVAQGPPNLEREPGRVLAEHG